jgi:hypothetical protein
LNFDGEKMEANERECISGNAEDNVLKNFRIFRNLVLEYILKNFQNILSNFYFISGNENMKH